ncbi:MAG: hypothetical protein ACTSRU_20480, partial [Candidatus Hodarchaeales archaeon]
MKTLIEGIVEVEASKVKTIYRIFLDIHREMRKLWEQVYDHENEFTNSFGNLFEGITTLSVEQIHMDFVEIGELEDGK